MTTLLPLLSQDCEAAGGPVNNPNSVLKAVSVGSGCLSKLVWRMVHLLIIVSWVVAWGLLHRFWSSFTDGDDILENAMADWIDILLSNIAYTYDDGMVLGMQVVVGSLMFIVHLVFELVFMHEMSAVMPKPTSGSQAWDPRKDGLPLRFRAFGLPSIWFSSAQALHDLTAWIDLSIPDRRISEVYPAELAFYALGGETERYRLQAGLKEAKLFNGKTGLFERSGDGSLRSLDIELCFFDSQLQRPDCTFTGEFLQLTPLEDDDLLMSASVPRLAGLER